MKAVDLGVEPIPAVFAGVVNAAFVGQQVAQTGPFSDHGSLAGHPRPTSRRTIWNLTADLAAEDVVARCCLGDTGPIEGANHKGIRWSEPITFALGASPVQAPA